MPKLRHYDHLGTARFITFSCLKRHKLLTEPAVITDFLDELDRIRGRHNIKLLAYVVMPEHVHLVLYPPDLTRFGPTIGELKSKSASKILTKQLIELPSDCWIRKDGRLRRAFWLPRCYDHNCQDTETVIEKINYCHKNPVTRGLVDVPAQWPWSSYNWSMGMKDVPLVMDEW